MGRTYLKPADVVTVAAEEGVTITVSTLATLRSRDPERWPFRKIGGRIYYLRADVEKALIGDQAARG